eukprot:gb/GECG01004695.1/.p1 GENE.gb/GECG01004695.1/~~gb/GECG01004695.1/.p1  ORF type:complete len:805 (+),score=37.20 gb/GECG01004695.1/:1-2415(+)
MSASPGHRIRGRVVPLDHIVSERRRVSPTSSSSVSRSAPRYIWETFLTYGASMGCKQLKGAELLRGPELFSKYLGVTGVVITRVWKYNSVPGSTTLVGHFLNIPRLGFSWLLAFFFGIILPTGLTICWMLPRLHPLSSPENDGDFIPLSETWGWIAQKVVVNLLTDLSVLCVQPMYLEPHDHVYFQILPTIAKTVLMFIILDLIPRAIGKFPVPLLGLLSGSALTTVVVAWLHRAFAYELPKYEEGRSKASVVQLLLSCGHSIRSFKNRLKWYIINHREHSRTTLIPHSRGRSKSVTSAKSSLRCIRVPKHSFFIRRRICVLTALSLEYLCFYLLSLSLFVLFRKYKTSSAQSALSIIFALFSIAFRVVAIPATIEKGHRGGGVWDGKNDAHISKMRQRYDKRVNETGVILATYFPECMSGVFLAFFLPELSSATAFVLLLLGELSILGFQGICWTRSLTLTSSLREGTLGRSLLDRSYVYRRYSSTEDNGDRPAGSRCDAISHETGFVPSPSNIQLRTDMLFEIRSPRLGRTLMYCPRSKEMVALGPSLEESEITQRKLSSTRNVPSSDLTIPIFDSRALCYEWALRWLAELSSIESTSSAWINANRRASSMEQRSGESGASRTSQQRPATSRRHSSPLLDCFTDNTPIPMATHASREGSGRDHSAKNIVSIGWRLGTSQRLFTMIFANVFSILSFVVLFPFIAFGGNRKSFPYEHFSRQEYQDILWCCALILVANISILGLFDLIGRCQFGISVVSVGMALFKEWRVWLVTCLSGMLSYALLWIILVDQLSTLSFLTEGSGQ